ncbi:MAG: SpoIID/LytB domain-containing protein [Calditrichia bacterium]
MATTFRFFNHVKLFVKIFLMSLIFTLMMMRGNIIPPGHASPNYINSWSECPPQSDTIWVQLDASHSPTGAENVVEIPFDLDTVQVGNYEYDNYVRGVLAGEVSTAQEPDGTVIQFDDETLKAMAVAIRTKVFHMCGSEPHDHFPDNDGIMRRGIRGQVIQQYLYNRTLVNYTEAERQRYQGSVNNTSDEYLIYNNDTFDIQYRNISIDPTNGSAAPHLGVADPVGAAHTGLSQTGLSQFNADHWAKGESHGTLFPQLNYRQILVHYYTKVHLKDANNTRLTPTYRWNPLSVDWGNGATSPPPMLQGQTYNVTIHLQNSGTANWTSGRNVRLSCRWRKPDGSLVNCSASTPKIIRTPGADATVTLAVTPDANFSDGAYTLLIDAKQGSTWFYNRDIGNNRPWFTLNYRVCVGEQGCQVFLPVILKNWVPGCEPYSGYWYPTGTNTCNPAKSNCAQGDGQPDGIWAGSWKTGYHQVVFSPHYVLDTTEVGTYWRTKPGTQGYGHLKIYAKLDGVWEQVHYSQYQSTTGRWENEGIGEHAGKFITGLRFRFTWGSTWGTDHQFQVDGYRIGDFLYCAE